MRIKNRLKFIVLATLVGLISSLFYNAVPQKVEAKTMYTNLYATKGVDTTSIFPKDLTPEDLNSLKYAGDPYKIEGKWNCWIEKWDKLELEKFEPEDPANTIPEYAEIKKVYLHGTWSRDNKEIKKAWVTIYKPGNKLEISLFIPEPETDISFSTEDLSNFLSTPADLNNAYIRFQAKSEYCKYSRKATTWHDQFKISVQYNNLELKDGYVWNAPNLPVTKNHYWSKNTDKVAASWDGFAGADIIKYEVGLGTSPSSTNICSFTDVNLNTQIEFTDTHPNCSGFPLINEQEYFFTVRAYTHLCPDIYKEVSSNGITIDTTPPDNPSVVGTPGDGEVTLSWNAVSDAVYYNIFRGGVLIAGHYTDLVFKDSGLTNDNKYQYRITAVDTLGNESTGTIINVTPVSATLGAILATATFRPTGAVAGVAVEPEEEGPSTIVEPGKVLAQEKTKDSPKTKNKAPYWGWLYLLIIFILILIGYYHYYLKDEYSQWYWVFPVIVAILLWFINRSLTRVFDGGLAAQLFWLWELIILALFAIFYNFWGVPKVEKVITKKFRKK